MLLLFRAQYIVISKRDLMTSRILVCTLLIILTACSQQGVSGFDANGEALSLQFVIKDDLIFRAGENSPYSGQLEVFNEEGSLDRVATFKDGYLDGPWEGFHLSTGSIKGKGSYRSGKLDGQYTWFDELGRRTGEGFYSDGKLSGRFIEFDSGGQIIRELNFVAGIRNGEYVLYHRNGVEKERGMYENGEKTGVSESFSSDGILSVRTSLVNGELDGLQEMFDERGVLKEIRCYKDGSIAKVSACSEGETDHCEGFLAVEESSKTQLPKKLDSASEMVSLSVDCESKALTHSIGLLVDEDALPDDWLVDKPLQLINLHCNQQGAASVYEWTVITRYLSVAGMPIAEVHTTPKDCLVLKSSSPPSER